MENSTSEDFHTNLHINSPCTTELAPTDCNILEKNNNPVEQHHQHVNNKMTTFYQQNIYQFYNNNFYYNNGYHANMNSNKCEETVGNELYSDFNNEQAYHMNKNHSDINANWNTYTYKWPTNEYPKDAGYQSDGYDHAYDSENVDQSAEEVQFDTNSITKHCSNLNHPVKKFQNSLSEYYTKSNNNDDTHCQKNSCKPIQENSNSESSNEHNKVITNCNYLENISPSLELERLVGNQNILIKHEYEDISNMEKMSQPEKLLEEYDSDKTRGTPVIPNLMNNYVQEIVETGNDTNEHINLGNEAYSTWYNEEHHSVNNGEISFSVNEILKAEEYNSNLNKAHIGNVIRLENCSKKRKYLQIISEKL